jgi:hypothetical protein
MNQEREPQQPLEGAAIIPEPSRKLWLTEGMILTFITVAAIPVITVTAYLCTLTHQIGLCNYFGISPDYISLSLPRVLFVSWPFAFSLMLITISLLLLVSAAWKLWDKFSVNDPFGLLRVNAVIAVILIVVSLGVVKSRAWGETAARQGEIFHVVNQYPGVPEVVVILIYGESLVTIPFDRASQTFEKKLYLLKVSEMATVPITLEKVGPLRLKP